MGSDPAFAASAPPAPASSPLRRLLQDERARHALAAVLIGVVACVAGGALRTKNLPLDDAYIHLSYGIDFSLRSLFSFQDFKPDTGTSSWLWTALCILVVRLHLPEHPTLIALGMATFCGILFQIMRLVSRALPELTPLRAAWAYASAVVLAASGNVIWLSLTGMETGLWILLLLALVPRLLDARGMTVATGILALLAVWTRIETLIWLGTAAAFLPFTGGPEVRRARRGWLIPLGGVALYLGYNLRVCGHLLPTTALAKRATFVQGGHVWKEEWAFLTSLTRNYVRPHLPGIQVALLAAVLSGLVLLALGAGRTLRRRAPLDAAGAAVSALVLATLAHALVNVVEFRSAYHHMRYFAPSLYLLPALFLTLVLRAAEAATARGVRVLRAPPLIAGAGAASGVLAAALVLWSLALDLRVFRNWTTLHLRNAEQLGAVHLAVGKYLREEAPPGTKRVASFDVGALRWASHLGIVDMGGVIDRSAFEHRAARKELELIRETHADLYVSIENGFDYLPATTPAFDLELIRSWQVREYFDPFPPHSKRMVLYRINHCGAPRLTRREVGAALSFDFDAGDARARAAAGAAEGDSFARWPVTARELDHPVPLAHGRFLASDAHKLRDRAVGRFETVPMRAVGDFLSFRLGGGHDPARLRVELRSGGAVLASWTGSDTEAFIEIVHPLAALAGKTFTLALVDEATGRWGHLMLDEVKQFSWREAPAKPCPKR
jgi:hypothetical protein